MDLSFRSFTKAIRSSGVSTPLFSNSVSCIKMDRSFSSQRSCSKDSVLSSKDGLNLQIRLRACVLYAYKPMCFFIPALVLFLK